MHATPDKDLLVHNVLKQTAPSVERGRMMNEQQHCKMATTSDVLKVLDTRIQILEELIYSKDSSVKTESSTLKVKSVIKMEFV